MSRLRPRASVVRDPQDCVLHVFQRGRQSLLDSERPGRPQSKGGVTASTEGGGVHWRLNGKQFTSKMPSGASSWDTLRHSSRLAANVEAPAEHFAQAPFSVRGAGRWNRPRHDGTIPAAAAASTRLPSDALPVQGARRDAALLLSAATSNTTGRSLVPHELS
eukprot:scaffold201_cov405-Prasinococcus_capsulatus_cf.AAC.20